MLTSPDVQERLDSAILAGDDDKIGGLLQESTDLLAELDALKGLIASGGSGDPGLVPKTLHRGGASDGPEAEDHGVVEDSGTRTGSDSPDSLDQVQDTAESREASNGPDSLDQDSAETQTSSDADGQDGPRIFLQSPETGGPSISFDDIEVWMVRQNLTLSHS